MASESFESRIERACRDKEIAGAIVAASDTSGRFRYEKAFGYSSLKNSLEPKPMSLDNTMWIASCTKLVTTVAVMQCVERGQLKLDEDITKILPELKDIPILKGMQGDVPILEKNVKPITLRHLLTHSSGLTYDALNPLLFKYQKSRGINPGLKIVGPITECLAYPLLFAPGESWAYGVGIDWAGVMVERVNDNISLEDYIQQNIWSKLGVKSFTFFPTKVPHVFQKLADMSTRPGGAALFCPPNNSNSSVEYTDDTVTNQEAEYCAGGSGGYCSPTDYQRILESLCANDEKILKKDSVDEMFRPQLTDPARSTLNKIIDVFGLSPWTGLSSEEPKVDWGLGGLLVLADTLDGGKKGTMIWCGYANLWWFIDRETGISGIFGSQLNLANDPKSVELAGLWKRKIYNLVSTKTS